MFAVFFTEILNFSLSIGKLLSITNLRPRFWTQLRAALCVIFARAAAYLILPAGLWANSPASLSARILLTVLFYLLGLYLTDCLTREDFAWFKTLLRRDR